MHNAASTILRALESISAQSKPVAKIIVVDDHSSDESRAVVLEAGIPNVELISTPRNLGAGGARNLEINHSTTDWVALLDSDDVWMPRFLEEVCAAITHFNADFGSSGGARTGRTPRGNLSTQRRVLDGYPTARELTRDFWRTAMQFVPINSSSAVIRKSLFEKAGQFPEDVRTGEDVALWARLWLDGRFVFVNQPLYESASIEGSLTAGKLAYSDLMRTLLRLGATLRDAARRRRPGTTWFGVWLAKRATRRHVSWLTRKIQGRLRPRPASM